MTTFEYISAVFALLLAPGPTNTLMGVAGAKSGWRQVLRLLPAELAGYLTTVLPLVVAGGYILGVWPGLAQMMRVIAGTWVMVVAVMLWRWKAGAADAAPVSARKVYLTTMLNPKALIFGLVLLPSPQSGLLAERLTLFCLMVVGAALVWGGAGALLQSLSRSPAWFRLIRQVASVWLALVALMLFASAVRAYADNPVTCPHRKTGHVQTHHHRHFRHRRGVGAAVGCVGGLAASDFA